MKKIEDFAIDLNHKLHKHEIILAYAGEINHKTMNTIINNIDEKIKKMNLDLLSKKRVFHVMVECLENLLRHNEPVENSEVKTDPFAVFTLMKEEKNYFLTTGNYIRNDQIEGLKEKIERINKMNSDEKKKLYGEVLGKGKFSEKGGAGLGIIEIAMRSSGELSYEFKPVNDTYSFYIFQTKILN